MYVWPNFRRHDTQHNDIQHNYDTQHEGLVCDSQHNNAECCFVECRILFIVMLSVIKLNVIKLSVVKLHVVMLSVVASNFHIVQTQN